jgi:RNA polymerase sigma-70 factor (ECF subfamily)
MADSDDANAEARADEARVDEGLMAKVARGDEVAFRQLSRRHVSAMVGLARRVLGNAADAEDVVQEAMLRVWTHAPRWQPLAAFRTWLTRVVVNLCLDRKRRKPWVDLEAAGEIADPAPSVPEIAEQHEREQALTAAIGELPDRQRTAVLLTYSEGMTNAQVAEVLDTSVSAVETLLIRGKKTLRAKLGAMIDGDEDR